MKSRLELEPKSNLQPLFEIVKPVLCARYPQITYNKELCVTAEAVTA